MTTTQTILQQLGGNKFVMMTGASCFSDGENTLIVKFKGCKTMNLLRITLTDLDLYKMEFMKFAGTKLTPRTEVDMVYHDMIQSIFTKETGLYTSL